MSDTDTTKIAEPKRATLKEQGKSIMDVTSTPTQEQHQPKEAPTQAGAATVQPIREKVLDRASEIITGDRQQAYGNPEDMFNTIAMLWEALFAREVSAAEVALALDLVKTARLIHNPNHHDSWVDKVGYSALGGEVSALESSRLSS